ncbi:EVE domain-containing protein [Aliikangiella coralliicola]|uniref:EVE domain-containing protein n=1 Tax=Aliikangiella coralliicola TaxID=2592383 RepID=A0A545UAB2_9GAMM|nr:EVE domain-containing protein [Aliikangiella coralliicola]TQV86414.1 EVE domain-containing protein [Aliikangiella coralliicola]
MNYWLFKTEPGEFSIDDLRDVTKPEPWDGIRNYQARNILRDQVKLDDQVLIYHSSCKNIGVAGTAKVVKEAYPDPAQFDPENHYFDPKSDPDNPRWVCVDVVFESKFGNIVPLKVIKDTPKLADMTLVKRGRLSVQPVTKSEFQLIKKMSKAV